MRCEPTLDEYRRLNAAPGACRTNAGIIRAVPELPEVETIARTLREGRNGSPSLLGRRIERVTLRWPGHVGSPTPAAFRRRIQGQVVRDVSRRGKFLVFSLDRGTLLVHLRMSGDLILAPAASPADRFERTTFHLDGGWQLRFSDARKFGRVFLVESADALLGTLGPEPLDRGFTAANLAARLASHRRALKPLLLDQGFLAGVGNIYADEALHRARLHPLRRSDDLSPEEIRSLWRGIRDALRMGLRHNGASLDWVYRGGDFQNHFRVYQRAGEPCPVCETPIVRRVIGQRAAHYCPSCQPEKAE
jgi:formamidopyrimidine-DNA glycosylase